MRLKEWGDTKMEDVKDLLGRLLNRVDGSGISDEDLNRQINAIYSIYASAVGEIDQDEGTVRRFLPAVFLEAECFVVKRQAFLQVKDI